MPRKQAVKRFAAKLAHHHVIHRHGDAVGVLLSSLAVLVVALVTANVTIRPEFAYFDPETGRTTASYSLEQQPTFYVDAPFLSGINKETVTAKVIDDHGSVLALEPAISGQKGRTNELTVTLPPRQALAAGKYTLSVVVEQNGLKKETKQDFTWGVLALNMAKSSYRSNEAVGIGAAVLDDRGATLCDAKLSIEVVQPDQRSITLSTSDNSINVSKTCADKTVTTKPDYLATYKPHMEGEYTVKMTALTKNGARSLWSSFTVSDSADFVTERRDTAMRLYPASTYDVHVELSANKDFMGVVEERVPHSFSVTNQRLVITHKNGQQEEVSRDKLRLDIKGDDLLLHWDDVTLQAGDHAEISYTYKPPFISPAFYQLGPLKLTGSGKTVFHEPHAWQLASDAAGDVILLWDPANGSVPSGWTCISCVSGDAFYQIFPRANSTYGASTGGSDTVAHTYTFSSSTGPSAVTGNSSTVLPSRLVGSNAHTHTFPAPTIGSSDIKPPYKQLQFIKASNPLSLPQNVIAMFDVASVASLPTNWTSYAALNDPSSTGTAGNGVYLRGENTNTTGGATTHTHTRSSVTSGSPSATTNMSAGTNIANTTSTHTHTLAAGNTSADNNAPSFISVVFAKVSTANEAIPNNMLAFFDNTTLPTGWTQQTTIGGNAFANRLLKGSLTAGTTGGSATHNHGGSQVITSGGPSATTTSNAAGLSNATTATSTHTHNATFTISSDSSMPLYRDVIIGKFATINVTGTVYSDEGTTTLGSLAVKGALNGSGYRSTTAAANGTYTLAMPDPGPGGIFTVWLDTNGGATGTTVTRSNGGAISGVDIYQNRLVATHEDGGPISNINLGTCDKTSGTVCADSDMHFDESSGNLTVDNDWRLYIKAGKTFTPGGSVTLSAGGTAASMGGDLKWGSSASTLNISNNALNVGGDWINTAGGTFTKTSGQTTTMNGTVTGLTIDASSKNFEKLTFNGTGGAWSFTPAATAANVDNDFTITNGSVTAPSGTLTVTGNWSNAGTFTHNSGTVAFNATTTGKTINPGSSSFNNVTFSGAGGAWSPLTNTMTVAGNLTVDNGTFDNSSGSANVVVNGHIQGTSGVINMTNNTLTQRVATGKNFGATSGASAWTFNNLTFSDSTGTPATITTQTGGTGNIVVTGNLVVSSTGDTAATTLNAGNRTWQLTNSNSANPFNLDQAGGVLSGATSTFEYTGDNDTGDVTLENGGYNNLTLGGAVAENYVLEGATATGDLLINANATLTGTQNMTVNGNVTGSGAVNLTGGLFTQRVGAAKSFGTTSGSNDWVFNNLAFENSTAGGLTVTVNTGGTGKVITNGALTVGNATDSATTTLDNETNDRIIDANGDVTITSKGNLLASSTAAFTIGGSYTNSGSFAAGTGLVTFDATTTGKTLGGSMTGSNKFNNLTFNGSGGAWSFGTNSADVGVDFTITAGSVTAPSTTLTVSNNYANSGTFLNNSGLVVFNATSTGKTINPGVSSPFNNVTFNGSGGGWNFQTNAAVINSDLLMVAGTLNSSVNVTVGGNVQCSVTCGTITIGSGTFTQSVSASKNFGTNVAVATNWSFNNLTLHATANTPTITFNGTGTGSTVVAGTFTVSKGAATSQTVDDATNNRIIDANGDVTISSGATFKAPPSASFTVNGSWSNAGTFTHSSGLVTFDSTASGKTIDGGSSSFYDATFNGVGGVWSPLTNTLTIANNMTLTNGTLDNSNGSANMTVNGHVQSTAGTISFTNNTFTQRVATSKNFGATAGSTAWAFNNLVFSNSSGASATITTQTGGSGDITVTGTLTVSNTGDTAGTVLNAGNRTWKLTNANQANPFNMDLAGGSLTGSTSTFEYTGDNDSGNVTVEDATYNNLTLGGPVVENYTPEGSTTATGNLLLNANATLNGTQNVTVNGNVSGVGAVNLSGASIFTQRVNAAQNFGTTSGSSNWVFSQLRFEDSGSVDRTVTVNTGGSGTITTNGLLTIGGLSDTNITTLDDETNDRTLDANGSVVIRATGAYLASSTVPLTIGGSYTNNGTFTSGTGQVIFDSTAGGNTISAGGTGAGKQFNKVTFNGSGGGWAIQTTDMATVSDLAVTSIGSLSLASGRTLEVRGTYSICDSCTSGTTWTGATLYLNSGTSYTVGSKTQSAEIYGTLQIGANTDIRTWRSSATTDTVDASGSLYSQHDANVVGALSIYGDYHVTGNDYWAYDTDFDGAALGVGSKRQAVVRIETGSGRGVTVDGGKTLTILGGGTGTNQFSDVNRIGGSGVYHLTNSGTVILENSKVTNSSFDGGTWAALNTVVSSQAVTAGALTTDWYLAPQVADADSLSPIDTASSDITISETSGSPASTVFKYASGWGSGATSQTADSGSDGRIAQPNSNNALKIREFTQTSTGTTYYQYNMTVAAQTSYAAYNYKNSYGKYITSTGNSASSEDKVIGASWFRDTIGTENTAPAINGSVTGGTWYAGMSLGVLAMWDTADGSIPTGWTCVSCTGGDPFYQRFLRGAATYGGTGGGPETHGHNLSSPSATGGGTFSALTGATNVAGGGHTHTWSFGAGDDTSTGDNKPPYKNVEIIRGPVSGTLAWPANIIMPFKTATAPTSWTAYTALDGRYPRGEGTNTTGGAATHTHSSNPLTSGASSGTIGTLCTTGCVATASAGHTHTLAATALPSANNDPLHINVRFMKHNDTSAPPRADMLALFDHTTMPTDYILMSDASPYLNNLLVGSSSNMESTGGSATHNHGGSLVITSSAPVEANGSAATGSVSAATGSHTHDVTYTIDNASSMPLYRDVVVAKYRPNLNPDAPTSLAQKKTDDTVISSGGWINQTDVKFTVSASDPDTITQQLQLCVEKKAIGVAFTGTEDSCGTAVSETGSGSVSLSATLSGLSVGQYHWQARIKDQDGAYGSWVEYDTTDINTRDFGIDTTAPTTAAVYDNTNLDTQPFNTDADQNADGSLTTLSATWVDFDANTSGLASYEYSIGTSAGATDVKSWTSNGTTRYVRAGSLSLQTNKKYYFNIRATDNAGNVSSVASTNGQIVTPTLTFDIDVDASDIETSPPYSIDFGSLTAASVASSPKKIWVDFDTNGVAGGRVYLAGLNNGLHSTAANFTITSTTSNLGTAQSGFGAQGATASQVGGGPFSISSPYNGTSDNVGALNTAFQSIFSTSNPITAGRGSFLLKVKPSSLTPASNDYSETLIIIAAGTY